MISDGKERGSRGVRQVPAEMVRGEGSKLKTDSS